jgi:hypothetical protein
MRLVRRFVVRGSFVAASLLAASLGGGAPVHAEELPGASAIAWYRQLAPAFEAAKKEDKPLFIAINSERVDGGRVEPAAKELREVTYRDARVIESSKRFVCAYLTSEGSSDDFGELRVRYAIEGIIVSPQHVFAYPDGSLLDRKEYWPHGYGERAVTALLDMMERAFKKDRARRGMPETPAPATPAAPAGAPVAPTDPEARARWISDLVGLIVMSADPETRKEALNRLFADDKDGAGCAALLARVPEIRKNAEPLADIARGLGRPGLEAAVPTLVSLLEHKDDAVRANAAVSLEYVGSKQAVDGLSKASAGEKDTTIANHMSRALGRCAAGGPDVDKVRDTLIRRISGAKSEESAYGPIIGLAYFEKDAKTARELEKVIVKEGVGSGGRRTGGGGALKGVLLVWCLTEIRDPKSERFVREKLLESVNEHDRWAGPRRNFFEAAAKTIAGDDAAKAEVQTGVTFVLPWVGPTLLHDAARTGRDEIPFMPKADWLRGTGGRPGPPGDDRNDRNGKKD